MTLRPPVSLSLALSLAAFGQPAFADALAPNDADIQFHGGLSYGTRLRTASRDPALVYAGNGTAAGVAASALAGRNGDDGNLNFAKHDPVSTVLKGVVSVQAKQGDGVALLRVKFWDDSVLAHRAMPWGNSINGYKAGEPLGQDGLPARAKASGLVVQDVYVQGGTTVAGKPLLLRLGQQNIAWGLGWRIGGGLAALTPLDVPAIYRPGALPEETTVPIPAAFGRLDLSTNTRLEGFYQLAFRSTVLPACGTFFSHDDVSSPGCNSLLLGGANDRTGFAAKLLASRAATPEVRDSGQFGIGAVTRFGDTEVGAYGAKYHSRVPFAGAVKTTSATTPFMPGNPLGTNAAFELEYPQDLRIWALTLRSTMNGVALAGELSYKPNQPVQINSTDQVNAFASNVAPSVLRADAVATAPGALFHGFDRLHVLQLLLSATGSRAAGLGGERLVLSAEAGVKVVNDLPDPKLRRFGRSDIYGVGPVAGKCSGGAAQCSFDGYVSRSAWGYRLRAAVTYPGVLEGVDLEPTLTYGADVRGWSYDGVFNEGRRLATVALKATYKKAYTAELSWQPIWGGTYNTLRDRSSVVASLGARF